MWKYYALLSALFASLTAIFSKLGASGVDSSLATAIRVTFVLFLVWGVAFFNGAARSLPQVGPRVWLWLLLSAAATGLSWLCYFRALEDGDVSIVAPLDKLSVPLTIAIAVVFLGEPLTWKTAVGGGLVAIGVLILAL